MDYAHLGRRIKEERMKLNLTQAQLAEDANISNSYMGYIERGEKSLSLETLINLANRFHVGIDYLLQDSLTLSNEHFIDQFKFLIDGKKQTEKQMAIDVIKTMYSYLS